MRNKMTMEHFMMRFFYGVDVRTKREVEEYTDQETIDQAIQEGRICLACKGNDWVYVITRQGKNMPPIAR